MTVKRFENFVDELRKNTDINVKYKDESGFMKFLGALLFFNKAFMTLFITTIGHTVYYPSRTMFANNPESAILVMAHEYVHIKDSERMGFWYKPSYLLPQALGLLSLLTFFAFLTPYAWFFLAFLIFFAPIPSPGRKNIELRGYKMSIFSYYLILKELNYDDVYIAGSLNSFAKDSNKYFTTSAYYFMWPFGVENDLTKFASEVISGDVTKDNENYKVVKAAFEASAE